METLENSLGILGLDFPEAEKILLGNSVQYRIAERDGERFMLIANYVPTRANLFIKDGKVVKVDFG